MRTILFLVLAGLISTAHAQKTIQPEEATNIAPNAQKIHSDLNGLSIVVKEASYAEFASDPIKFMKANFDIKEYMKFAKDKKYDTYLVSFSSPAGRLDLDFDKRGQLRKNTQYFNDVQLPPDIERALQQEHNGWIAVKTKFTSKGVGEYTDGAFYRVKLQNGKKTRNIKLIPESKIGVALAGSERQ
jgi:hypothetical protein